MARSGDFGRSAIDRRIETAHHAYKLGRSRQAYIEALGVLEEAPRHAGAHFLAGLCLIDLRDFDAAERSLRAATGFDRRNPHFLTVLGDLQRRPTRFADAEKAYRAALKIDRHFASAAVGLAQLLNVLERHEEALQLTTPFVAGPAASASLLETHVESLKHLHRFEEALEVARLAVTAGSLNSRVDVANILRELGRYGEAEAWARTTFDFTGDAPAAFVVHARTLQELSRGLEAEDACREAVRRSPLDDRAHEHLAELMFRRTGDAARSNAMLDAALKQSLAPNLIVLKAKLLGRDKQFAEALDLLASALRRTPGDPRLHAAAAKAALKHAEVDEAYIDLALSHAEQAHMAAHDLPKVTALLAEACLAAGQADRASDLAGKLLLRSEKPALVALQAVAWRMLGDPRYQELYDYERVVGTWTIDAPAGWRSLEAYLKDLSIELGRVFDMPEGGSPGQGAAESRRNLMAASGDTIGAFYKALDEPIRDYLSRLGRGRDILRRRNGGGYRVSAAWTIKAHAGGFHINHLHPEGWLSSAFYVETPPAVNRGREGWIKFGQPGVPTRPQLGPEHWIKPEPGRFLLFPSYIWHGTETFRGEGARMIMSVDLLPSA